MDTKTCTHCGETKPLSSFRHYYGKCKGSYRYCKTCEKINTRYRYLVGKGANITDVERQELAKITKLYDARAAAGLETPLHKREYGGATELVDQLLDKVGVAK